MKITKTLLIAIIAALPFGANAANIQGDMYVAPTWANEDHPAPRAETNPPYGRVNIDTTDQGHIATTAYVKGAYNSAIGGINHLGLMIEDFSYTISEVVDDLSSKRVKIYTTWDDDRDSATTEVSLITASGN